MKTAIVVFPGTNCDIDTFKACEFTGWSPEYIWHKETSLKDFDCVILPGGFSYGDYINAGRLAKFSPIMQSVKEYINQKSGFVLGICNGFQILCESNLLPGALTYNENGRFICDDALLEFNEYNIELPIAHKEGRFICDEQTLVEIKQKDMNIIKYKNNYNGSIGDIAGLYDNESKVFGLMPHPERAVLPYASSNDGKSIFKFIEEQLNAR